MKKYKGIALDIGTTNIAAALITDGGYMDLHRTVPNPQGLFSTNLVGRISAAEHSYAALRSALLQGVNSAVADLCSTAGVKPTELPTVAVGNTLMCCFFLGLPVDSLGKSPYTAPSLFGDVYSVSGYIGGGSYVAPAFGSFVGGDISAGILCTDMKMDGVLYIDAGTNGEVYGSYAGKSLACSAAAGPALEKGITGGVCGGVAYSAVRENGALRLITRDGKPPASIAGSGVIELVALMIGNECGENGRIEGDSLELGGGLCFTAADMTAFQLAKAAIAAATLCVVRGLGMPVGGLKRLYVAGAMGSAVSEGALIRTGLVPGWAAGKVQAVGNGALKGAALLFEEANRQKLKALCEKTRVLPLDKSEYFKERFAEELFFYE